jgi:N-methylhydantoinase B/oxoprolinase/acetone carboxylase alpha subunit
VITDAAGNSLAQSYLGEVMIVTTFPDCVRNILREVGPENMRAGDVYITNDPWLAAGHLPDIHIATPVFRGDRLVAFSGSVIHVSDIGGRFGPHDAREVFEEGLRIPILKLIEGAAGPNDAILKILRANVRTWELSQGDVMAQVAGNAVGARLILEFLDEYKLNDLVELSEALQERVEQAMRRQIQGLPDGVFEHETEAEFGVADDTLLIKSTITIDGDEITVDYTGSSPQTNRAGVNCVMNCTRSLTLYPLHAMLLPDVPAIEGLTRPIKIFAPPGTIMNALHPAPVDVRATITHLLPDHVMTSLAAAAPERVLAASGVRWMLMADRVDSQTSRRTITSFFQAGGMGAGHDRDGPHAKFFPIKGYHTAVERFEVDTGLIVEEKSIRRDSGGAGRFRGGNGQRVVFRNPTSDPVQFTFYRPQIRRGPRGLAGGGDGESGRALVDGQPLDSDVMRVPPGSRVVLETPGGAGFGDPAMRAAPALAEDIRQGYVSAARATIAYGVDAAVE